MSVNGLGSWVENLQQFMDAIGGDNNRNSEVAGDGSEVSSQLNLSNGIDFSIITPALGDNGEIGEDSVVITDEHGNKYEVSAGTDGNLNVKFTDPNGEERYLEVGDNLTLVFGDTEFSFHASELPDGSTVLSRAEVIHGDEAITFDADEDGTFGEGVVHEAGGRAIDDENSDGVVLYFQEEGDGGTATLEGGVLAGDVAPPWQSETDGATDIDQAKVLDNLSTEIADLFSSDGLPDPEKFVNLMLQFMMMILELASSQKESQRNLSLMATENLVAKLEAAADKTLDAAKSALIGAVVGSVTSMIGSLASMSKVGVGGTEVSQTAIQQAQMLNTLIGTLGSLAQSSGQFASKKAESEGESLRADSKHEEHAAQGRTETAQTMKDWITKVLQLLADAIQTDDAARRSATQR